MTFLLLARLLVEVKGVWMAVVCSRGRAMEPCRSGSTGRDEEESTAPMSVPPARDIKREQEKLSGVVKSVHRSLRRKYLEVPSISIRTQHCERAQKNLESAILPDLTKHLKAGDFDKIWKEHCQDEEKLFEYAAAMKNLAGNHWAKKCEGEGRIEWCLGVCQEYFFNGGKRKAIEKDARRAALNNHQSAACEQMLASGLSISNGNTPNQEFHLPGKIRLLDVGSCYNPFVKYEDFLAVGIDIVPAVETVYKCDFLNLQFQRPLQLAPDAIEAFLRQLKNPIDHLPSELFHVVVFSLLLSYFPSRYQRWICCKKAHELLALNGLLLIITPDSSHQNRHAMMMKSWKIAIESLGFKRMTYSKFSHMHLMAFRKTSLKTTSDLITRNYPDMLYIPQDFNYVGEEEYSNPLCARSDLEDEQLAYTFSELPDTPYDSDSGESQTSSMSFYEFEDPILLLS